MSAARSIIKSVAATKAGPFVRLVGSLDFKGKGTKHSLEDLDPFVLCDDGGRHVGKGLPPFGVHPHAGLIAISFVLEGGFSDYDNVTEPSQRNEELNCAGGIYAVSSGRGVAHEEKTAVDGPNRLIQTIVKIPINKLDLEPELCRAKEEDLPLLKLEGGLLRLCVGQLASLESPVKLKALPRVVIARIQVDIGACITLPVDQDLEHGFLYVVDGEGCVKGEGSQETIINQAAGACVFGPGHELIISNSSANAILDIFFASGKPLQEPWKKLLGFNGFVIGQDEQDAEAIMAKVEEVGVANFNFKAMAK